MMSQYKLGGIPEYLRRADTRIGMRAQEVVHHVGNPRALSHIKMGPRGTHVMNRLHYRFYPFLR